MIATSQPQKTGHALRDKFAAAPGAAADSLSALNHLFRMATLLTAARERHALRDSDCGHSECPQPARCTFAGCQGVCRPQPPAA